MNITDISNNKMLAENIRKFIAEGYTQREAMMKAIEEAENKKKKE